MSCPIEDYALIGDCETAALVGNDGSIDWLCWPRFDSGACFAAILGTPEHGRWKIAPATSATRVTRHYRKGTLILETEFETEHGTVTIIDFMPLRERQSDLVRLVRGRQGEVPMKMELSLRFDYGQSVPWVTRLDDGSLRAIAGTNMVVLLTSAPIHGENLKTVSEFTVKAGETVSFVLTYSPSHLALPKTINVERAIKTTEEFWQKWTQLNCLALLAKISTNHVICMWCPIHARHQDRPSLLLIQECWSQRDSSWGLSYSENGAPATRSAKFGGVNPSTYRMPKSRRMLSTAVIGF